MFENLPEVIIVGDIELFFIGVVTALGAPKFATKLAAKRYGDEAVENIDEEETVEEEVDKDKSS